MKINHAILHIFDFVACENTFAQEEIDLTNKAAKNYVSRLAKKVLGDLDSKLGEFSADSLFAPEVKAYFRGQRDFVDLSAQIGEFLVGELGHMEKSTSTDLLVIDFEEGADTPAVPDDFDPEAPVQLEDVQNRYLALLLLESKQAYMHAQNWGEAGSRNDVERHQAILPNPSQKIPSYAVISLRSMDVLFQDKARVIAGEETFLIPDGLLQCSTQASAKETITVVNQIVEEVAQEYGANTAVALSTAKSYAHENATESDDLDLEDFAEEVFGENAEMARRFHEEVAERNIPEKVTLRREAVSRVTRSHKIVTDTGIVITFPAEYSKSDEFISFTSESDGTISIALKNIASFENK